MLVALLAVHAFSRGGDRRLTITTLILIPCLMLVEIVDQIGDPEASLDVIWIVFSITLPLTAAALVRLSAAVRLNRFAQFLMAFGGGILLVVLISMSMS